MRPVEINSIDDLHSLAEWCVAFLGGAEKIWSLYREFLAEGHKNLALGIRRAIDTRRLF
jgi:hypothetical protein